MLPGQVSIAAWLPHVRSSFIWWRHFSSGESLGDESKDYTDSPQAALHQLLVRTFDFHKTLQHNPYCPGYRLSLKTIFSTFQLSVVLAWWSCLGRSIIPWPTAKTKFKICTNLLTYFAFQPQHRESESDTIIIRAGRTQTGPVTPSSWQYLWQYYINDTEKFHGKKNNNLCPYCLWLFFIHWFYLFIPCTRYNLRISMLIIRPASSTEAAWSIVSNV